MKKIPVFFAEKPPTFDVLSRHGTELSTDWSGSEITKSSKFLFWVDRKNFHFLASQNGSPGLNHPDSQPGQYQAELWKYDVAEFFLLSADKTRYLEFNLSPNGAWWTSAFTAPLKPAPGEPAPIPEVETSAEITPEGWRARSSIPLAWIQENYGFGKSSFLNACFILNSPDQIFVTAGYSPEGKPDYHRPDLFPQIKILSPPLA